MKEQKKKNKKENKRKEENKRKKFSPLFKFLFYVLFPKTFLILSFLYSIPFYIFSFFLFPGFFSLHSHTAQKKVRRTKKIK